MSDKQRELEAMFQLASFIGENKKAGGLSQEVVDKIKEVWDEYKVKRVEPGTSIINADFGQLGSLVVRDVVDLDLNGDEPLFLKYEDRGEYDFISIKYNKIRTILWTDYKDIEPYNRQSGLYADGSSFKRLGKPVKMLKEYREFDSTQEYNGNLSFAVCGFNHNDFYNSVRFGICLPTEKSDEFISKLRKIIGK